MRPPTSYLHNIGKSTLVSTAECRHDTHYLALAAGKYIAPELASRKAKTGNVDTDRANITNYMPPARFFLFIKLTRLLVNIVRPLPYSNNPFGKVAQIQMPQFGASLPYLAKSENPNQNQPFCIWLSGYTFSSRYLYTLYLISYGRRVISDRDKFSKKGASDRTKI